MCYTIFGYLCRDEGNNIFSNRGGLNYVNIETFTQEGEMGYYNSNLNMIDATPNLRYDLNTDTLTFNNRDYKFLLGEDDTTNKNTNSLLKRSPTSNLLQECNTEILNTADNTILNMFSQNNVQLQLTADTNNLGEQNTASVFFGGDGTATKAYVGFLNNQFSIVSRSTSNPTLALYVDTTDFDDSNNVKKPSEVSPPTPGIHIDSTNVPEFRNGLLMPNTVQPGTDTTLNVYKRESFTEPVLSQPSNINVTNGDFKFTQVGDMIQLSINIQVTSGNIIANDDVFRISLPSYCRPDTGISPLPPYFVQSIIIEKGAANTNDVLGCAKIINSGGVGTLEIYEIGKPIFDIINYSILCTISYKSITF